MRILAITNLFPNPYQPNRGIFNWQQVRLVAERHPTRVIAPILWTEELAVRAKVGRRLGRDRRLVRAGVAVEHPLYLYPPRTLRNAYGICYRESVRPAFRRALAEFQPDLIFASWAYPDGWSAVELGHQAGLPVVVKLHGSDLHTLKNFPGRFRGTIAALRSAEGIIAVSRDLADRAIAHGAAPERVRVIYDGVDPELFHPGSRAEARARLGLAETGGPVLLFVGNLVPVKGIDLLIDACAELARAGQMIRCRLIGDGPLRRPLEQQAARLGLQGQVELLGPVPHAQLPDWYRAADLFVLPSHSEGVPCVLLEAIACGTPFVATAVGGVPEIAHLGVSRLVPPGDAAALAHGIHTLLREAPTAAPAPPLRTHEAVVLELEETFVRALQTRAGTAPGAAVEDHAPPAPPVPTTS